MTTGAPARSDRVLVGAAFLAGGAALPWLPGPWLPEASPLAMLALAFFLPVTALAACVGQAVFAARSRTHDEASRASADAIATVTTALCSFALSLQLLVLTTLVNAPFRLPAPARAAMMLLGVHLVIVGNVLPRLRPGRPLDVSPSHNRRHAWMRIYRTAGYLSVVIGIVLVIAGASLGGPQIDALLKIVLIGAGLILGWSVRRVRAA